MISICGAGFWIWLAYTNWRRGADLSICAGLLSPLAIAALIVVARYA